MRSTAHVRPGLLGPDPPPHKSHGHLSFQILNCVGGGNTEYERDADTIFSWENISNTLCRLDSGKPRLRVRRLTPAVVGTTAKYVGLGAECLGVPGSWEGSGLGGLLLANIFCSFVQETPAPCASRNHLTWKRGHKPKDLKKNQDSKSSSINVT